MSRIATGNWDAVIVTHSGFERIPLSDETKQEFFRRATCTNLELAIREQQGRTERSPDRQRPGASEEAVGNPAQVAGR